MFLSRHAKHMKNVIHDDELKKWHFTIKPSTLKLINLKNRNNICWMYVAFFFIKSKPYIDQQYANSIYMQ